MKLSILVVMASLVAMLASIGCQKKGDDDPGVPACGAGTVYSPFWARCVSQTGCPQGAGQHPEQPSNCMNLQNGVIISSLQCGSGYLLTSKGCLTQGTCPAGMAQYSDMCTPVVAGTSPNMSMGGMGGYNPYYNNQINGAFQNYPAANYNPYYNPYRGY